MVDGDDGSALRSGETPVIGAITWGRFAFNAGVGLVIGLVFIGVGLVISRRGQPRGATTSALSPGAERARGGLAAAGLVLVAFGALFVVIAVVATVISLVIGHPV
jgi:hypothetical protein